MVKDGKSHFQIVVHDFGKMQGKLCFNNFRWVSWINNDSRDLDINLNSILSGNNVMIVTMKNVLESLLINVEIFLEWILKKLLFH